MTFLSPVMLWSLAALLPLLAVYFLKVRPARKQTSTLFLWEQLVPQTRSSALLRRLRDLLSLLLMAMAVAALGFAMARPTFQGSQDNRDLILIVDHSLSMNALDGGKSRLEQAKQAALNILGSMTGQRRAAVAVASRDIRFMENLTDNQRALTKAVGCIEPGNLSLRTEAIQSVSSDQIDVENSRVIFITDGCFENSDKLGGVELLKIGTPLENIGISRFDLLPLPGNPARLGLFFELASSFREDKKLDVLLCHGSEDNIVKICPVTVKPGVNSWERFTVNHDSAGRWILKIKPADSLQADDVAYAVVPEHDPIRVAVSAESCEFFLSRCIDAFSRNDKVMQLVQTQPEVVLANGTGHVHAAGQVIFNPTGQSPFWEKVDQETDGGTVKVLLPEHPAVRLCNLEMINWTGRKKITPPEGSVVLAETDNGVPLVYKAYHNDQVAYVVNMDPVKSEFFLSAYFPIMTYAMAVDLTGKARERNVSVSPGSVVENPLGKTAGQWTVTDPQGLRSEYFSGQPVRIDRPGFYLLQNEKLQKELACSQADRTESLLDNSGVTHSAGPLPQHTPPSTILMVVALMLIVIESVLYHRRKVG